MSYEPNQPPFLIFDGNVPDVSPVHHARSEIDQVVGLHRE
jgi:hypothetical protein